MGHMELIRMLQTLPTDKQAEVVDFVEFLAARFAVSAPIPAASESTDWTDASFSQFSMQQAQRSLGQETVSYSAADLKESWQ